MSALLPALGGVVQAGAGAGLVSCLCWAAGCTECQVSLEGPGMVSAGAVVVVGN